MSPVGLAPATSPPAAQTITQLKKIATCPSRKSPMFPRTQNQAERPPPAPVLRPENQTAARPLLPGEIENRKIRNIKNRKIKHSLYFAFSKLGRRPRGRAWQLGVRPRSMCVAARAWQLGLRPRSPRVAAMAWNLGPRPRITGLGDRPTA